VQHFLPVGCEYLHKMTSCVRRRPYYTAGHVRTECDEMQTSS